MNIIDVANRRRPFCLDARNTRESRLKPFFKPQYLTFTTRRKDDSPSYQNGLNSREDVKARSVSPDFAGSSSALGDLNSVSQYIS